MSSEKLSVTAPLLLSPRSEQLPLPSPLNLRRTSSSPSKYGSLEPLDRVRKKPKGPRKSSNSREDLVRAVETLTFAVESFGARLNEKDGGEMSVNELTQSLESFLSKHALSRSYAQQEGEKSGVHCESTMSSGGDCGLGQDDCLNYVTSALGLHMERLSESQVKKTACKQRLVEEKALQNQVLREMVEAIQSLRNPPIRKLESTWSRAPRYYAHIGSNGRLYQFPEVQVTLKFYQVCNVELAQLTFEADFVCTLDWSDHNVEGIPSEELKNLDWSKYFNPYMIVDNEKGNSGWLDGFDSVPRRRRSVSGGSLTGSAASANGEHHGREDIGLGPCLRKTMRFRGTLAMGAVSLRCFPFDIHMLPVRLKAARFRELALGTPSITPQVTTEFENPDSSVVQLVGPETASSSGAKIAYSNSLVNGHCLMETAGDSLLEFKITGLSGYLPDPMRSDIYEVDVFIHRPPFASYFWDLVIMNLLVMLAATAFWDTAVPQLSSRMSISLTIILTLAAYTSSRPPPITRAPYITFHDWSEQASMFLVVSISVENVFAVVTCGGQHEEAPPYMQAEFDRNKDMCAVGWCMSRKIDCHFLALFLVVWMLLILYSCWWLVRTRRRATQLLRERILFSISPGMSEDEIADLLESSDSVGSWSEQFCRQCRCRRRFGVHKFPHKSSNSDEAMPASSDDEASDEMCQELYLASSCNLAQICAGFGPPHAVASPRPQERQSRNNGLDMASPSDNGWPSSYSHSCSSATQSALAPAASTSLATICKKYPSDFID